MALKLGQPRGEFQSFSSHRDARSVLPMASQLSLQQLTICSAYFDRLDTPFPAVHTLDTYRTPVPAIAGMIHLFPKLRNLEYCGNITEPGISPEEMEEYRDINYLSQLRSRWTSLDRLTGAISDLYMLGVLCHVRLVDVIDFRPKQRDNRLRLMLQDVHPLSLRLQVTFNDLSRLPVGETWDILLPSVPNLIHTIIHVSPTSQSVALRAAESLLASPELIRKPTTNTSLPQKSVVHFVLPPSSRFAVYSMSSPPLNAHPCNAVGLELYAKKLMDRHLSLEYIIFQVPPFAMRYWQIIDDQEESRRLVQLDDDAGHAIMAREGLLLA